MVESHRRNGVLNDAHGKFISIEINPRRPFLLQVQSDADRARAVLVVQKYNRAR